MADEAPPSYPKFFQTIVGVSENKIKSLSADDMKALCDVFEMATGSNPLTADKPLNRIYADVLMGR